MSASVVRGFTRSTWNEQDWVSTALLLAPSCIMYRLCLVSETAVPANVAFHAFMLLAILGNGWSLFGRRNAFRHREGALAKTRYGVDGAIDDAAVRRRAAKSGVAMFGIGIAWYATCRACSAPDFFLGVDRFSLRRTLDGYGIDDQRRMLVFSCYFATFNPWLEEIFWRQMLRWRLRLRAAPRVGDLKPSDAHRVAAAERHADLLSAVAYSAYHSVIIARFMPLWFNVGVAFPFLAGMGFLLNRVADHPGLGVPVCVGVHAGLDAASALWVLDMRFGYLDSFFP